MLVITHTGIVVNTDHLAFIALKQVKADAPLAAARYQVLLMLTNRDRVVATAPLTRPQALRVRSDLARCWAQGERTFAVPPSVPPGADGAPCAQEAKAGPLPDAEGGR